MPRDNSIKKVLIIGSGPIVIGQAAEFDYAGTQGCKVLKDEGINVVLVNSNPATIMTDQALADEIYLEPLTQETIKRIIKKEHPDSMIASLGGQTGLTIAHQLAKSGFLDKENVRLLGTDVNAIDKAEDRKMFKDTMASISQPTIPSDIANDTKKAKAIADIIGYPIIIRPAFTLGGTGGGVAYTEAELLTIAELGLDASPIHQILVEKYIYGWKEIEFEAIRDRKGNVIAVCSMENVDPVGVHTGDSIVVAPALTLSDKEFQMLRSAALNIITELGIVGGCNVQFALDPDSFNYAVIEVNPRVSRSSALASKATGYPIAKVTAQLALGYTLDEIRNDITGKTCLCFEPAIDYVVVKFPKWPFDKFATASHKLGTQMKATGEVMAIAPSFEMALMKAVRGAEISKDTLNHVFPEGTDILLKLHDMDDIRLFTIFEALKQGVSIDEINRITKIDKWFIAKINKLVEYEKKITVSFDDDDYLTGKKLGYTDLALKRISGKRDIPHIDASYKMVDTCAAEFEAATPYFYSTYDKQCEARQLAHTDKQRIIVLGSGPIRIGQGIEFDYSSVHCVWALKDMGYEVIIINNNPETVSTDYNTADRLYFEPLTPEDVMNVIKVEKPIGVVVAFGGQTAIKLTKFLDKNNIPILGTSAEGIDMAEDRERFDELLGRFNIKRPKGMAVMTLEQAISAANELSYPVLLRPSYVIGGQNMVIAYTEEDIIHYMNIILALNIENPVLVDKYMMGTELEVDVISDGEDILLPGIMEHIERAGVHSGDSIAVYPPYNLNDVMLKTILECSKKLTLSLGTKGLVNIQYLIYENELYVIEVNPRASRTVPYISKVTGIPMVEIASKVMLGQKLKDLGFGTGLYRQPPYVAVKVPVFSFEKLSDANSTLGPEMKSTGEVLGIGKTINEALFKGLTSAGFKVDTDKSKGILISVDKKDRMEILKVAKKFHEQGIRIYATKSTAEAIATLGMNVIPVNKLSVDDTLIRLLDAGKIKYIICTIPNSKEAMDDFIRLHKRAIQLSVPVLTSLDTANALADIIASRFNQDNTELVDICHMRKERLKLSFAKMQGSGNDYIYFDNRENVITCPESLAIDLCNRHFGIGGDGVVLIENSGKADAKMRIFNKDGSEGRMAGNSIRCIAKYVYDRGICRKNPMFIDTASGIKELKLYTINDLVSSACVSMGKAELNKDKIPVISDTDTVINKPIRIGDERYNITCVSVGNPHCVVFVDRVEGVNVEEIGPKFENAPIFPERINTEFIRVVNKNTIKMRVWERGNGETMACGTGACAAVVAAVENGFCEKNTDITVNLRGGDLIVNYSDEGITLTGNAVLICEGTVEI